MREGLETQLYLFVSIAAWTFDLASEVLMPFNEDYIIFVAFILHGTANSIVPSDS
jgi:hypothetical protein